MKIDPRDYENYLADRANLPLLKEEGDYSGYEVKNLRTLQSYKVNRFLRGEFNEDTQIVCNCPHYIHRLAKLGRVCKHMICVWMEWESALEKRVWEGVKI